MYRTVTFFRQTALPQPGLEIDRRSLSLDLDQPMPGPAMKLGVHNDAGWVAYALGQQALVSFVPFDPDTRYPEGGGNITLYQADSGQRRFAEMEQVGPAVRIAPGEEGSLYETLRLVTLPLPLPNADATADVLRATIEQSLRTAEESTTGPSQVD